MYVALLGRQPALGIAELERVFGGQNVNPLSNLAAIINTDTLDIELLGGTLKAGKVVIDLASGDWHSLSKKVIQYYLDEWSSSTGKITLGLGAYGFEVGTRDIQKIGLVLKQKLKSTDASLRLIPNQELALSTATSHHNKLGLSPNKIELLMVRADNGRIIVAQSTGAQNITAYAKRDQQRPKRDTFVGMLPPKLAQIMINLALDQVESRRLKIEDSSHNKDTDGGLPPFIEGGILDRESQAPRDGFQPPVERPLRENGGNPTDLEGQVTVLDPFCGTGVILQEAAIMGHRVYGTDLSDKMVSFSRDNLAWLARTHHLALSSDLHSGDAMTAKWRQPIDAVVTEAYLGQPFSAPPSPTKLDEVRKNCNHIITEFLKNLAPQIKSGVPVCIAIPAWRDRQGDFTHLPLVETVGQLGYKRHEFTNISQNDLLYYREDQIVARELLVLTKV